jgi:hypothetical protein
VTRLGRFAAFTGMCGAVVLTGGVAVEHARFGSPGIGNATGPVADSRAASVIADAQLADAPQAAVVEAPQATVADAPQATIVDLPQAAVVEAPRATVVEAPQATVVEAPQATVVEAPQATAMGDGVSAAHTAMVDAALPEPLPTLSLETPPLHVATASTPDPVQDDAKAVETPDECPVAETCIDQYLWSIYQRTPKVDTIKVPEKIKVTVKKKGKTRTVIRTVTKFVDEDFTLKDPKAAQRVGMSLMDYVIGGVDRSFKLKLYHALRALDDAGLSPGITSGFRDDYRQSLASGNKAATDSSYHGGSRRGGYGHGLAVDLVSVKGETRPQRWISSDKLWNWIDAHGKEYGIGRPYLDRDAPHVAPIDGKEYADHRGGAHAQLAGLEAKGHHRSSVQHDHKVTKRARAARLSRASST